MTDCSKIPTLTLVEDAKKAMEDTVLFAGSPQTTYVSKLDGETQKTITGITEDALNAFRLGAGNHQGDYSVGVTYDESNWTYTYNGQQWGLRKDFDLSTLPYQTTEIDPNNDVNLAVRGSASEGYVKTEVTTAQNDIIGGSVYKGSNGEYVQNGDIIPSGTTHLRANIGGKPEIVAISPLASGVISALTDTGASIGVSTVTFYTTNALNFPTVAALKSAPVSTSLIDAFDIPAKTISNQDGWAALAKPLGAAEYVLTTKERVRDSLSNPTWEPDGYVNHGLFGGSDYVAMLQFSNSINAASCGASDYSNGDNTTAMSALVDFINNLPSTYERVVIDLDGAVSRIEGSEIFKFSREFKKISVVNGSIIWEPANTDDRLFFIDENVKKIKCDVDIFTTIDVPDNIPRGDIFYFFSELGDFTSSGNKFEDMFVSGSETGAYAPIRNVFNSQGYGQNDQTKVINCRFETYFSVFRCFNPESVNWNFDRCGFFSIVLNHRAFWFDTLFGNFSVTNSSFSMAEQLGSNFPTLLYTRQNNSTYPAPSDCNFLFENVRIESYTNTGTENIRIVDADFGTIRFENIQTNLADANARTWNIIGDAYVYIAQSTLGREIFTTEGLDGTVPIQKAFLEMDTVDVVNIPQLTVNGIPMAFEYFEADYEARLVIFRNVKDVITGRTINFTSYSDDYASGRFEEVISKPNSDHILQPFCTIDSIKFNYNTIDAVTYPKVRVRVAKGVYNVEFDLSSSAGDYELLPANKYLMYMFNHNDGNLARIKFTLLDGTDTPQPTVDFNAEITLSYTPISPRIAGVVGGVNVAKIVNMFGV